MSFLKGTILVRGFSSISRLLQPQLCSVQTNSLLGVRNYKQRDVWPTMLEFNKGRDKVALDEKLRYGKQTIPRRSDFLDWNYSSELHAFQARLGEKFDDAKLREAFISPDYVEAERRRQVQLGIVSLSEQEDNQESRTSLQSNVLLAKEGRHIIEITLMAFIRAALPYLPEEGVEAITSYLTTDELLAHVSFHIGTMDLVLSEEYPPSVPTMRYTLEALIGALAATDKSRAERLVIDVIATQLHGQDLSDIWDVPDPMGLLAQILANDNHCEPESRLLWSSGKETILACYHVGIYSNRELIGQAPGETATIAEEMAARDALRRLFRFDDASSPLPFGKQLDRIQLKTEPNRKALEWKSENIVLV